MMPEHKVSFSSLFFFQIACPAHISQSHFQMLPLKSFENTLDATDSAPDVRETVTS